MVKFKESQEILDKLFKWLLGVISFFKATDIGEDYFTKHPNVVMSMVLMIELFFLVWLLGTMLRHRVECLQMILVWIILVLGSVASVLVLTIIYSPIAWFAGLLCVGVFAASAYYYYHELYKLFVCSVSDVIKKLIESYQLQGTRLPV